MTGGTCREERGEGGGGAGGGCPVSLEEMTPGGGGALRYQVDNTCQTAVWSGSGERQHIIAIASSLWDKTGV